MATMVYESRVYDQSTDGFGPEPVAVLVVTGTHDVSRLAHLFNGAPITIEQMYVGERLRRQANRHAGGRSALKLLKDHGGPDFREDTPELTYEQSEVIAARLAEALELDRRVLPIGPDVRSDRIRDLALYVVGHLGDLLRPLEGPAGPTSTPDGGGHVQG